MKTNWQIKKLNDVCDFYNGLWKGKKPPYIEVGVIRNTNFTKEGELDDSDIAYLEVEKKQFENRKLTYGDIILEKSGGGPKQPVGRVVIFNKKEGDFSFSNFTSAIRVKKSSELDFNFLHRLLFFSYISGITEKMQSHSTGIRNLDSKLYKNIEIPLPPLPEQHRIVKILDEVFADTAKAKENAEKNLQNAKELFESYLQSVFANPGKGWEETTIGRTCNLMTGGTPSRTKKEYFKGGEINWLVSGDINKKDIKDCDGKITELGLNNSNAKYLPINSVMIALNGQGKTRGTVAMLRIKATCNQSLVSIYPKDDSKLIPELIFSNLTGRYNELRRLTGDTGNDRRGLNMPLIRNIKFSFPKSLTNQKSIVAKLDALSAETKKLEVIYKQKLADLEELKKSVLSKAFKGEL